MQGSRGGMWAGEDVQRKERRAAAAAGERREQLAKQVPDSAGHLVHGAPPTHPPTHPPTQPASQPASQSAPPLPASLTGVATTTSGCVRSVAACACRLSPPTTSAAWMSVNCASFCSMLCTCA